MHISRKELREYYNRLAANKIRPGLKKPHGPGWKGSGRRKVLAPLDPTRLDKHKEPDFSKEFNVNGRMRRLTNKQITQIKYMLAGYSSEEAKRHAGYSVSTVKEKISHQQTIMAFLQSINKKFVQRGINEDFIAGKVKTWFDAKKTVNTKEGPIEVEDYNTQLQAFDKWKEIALPKDFLKGDTPSRQVTLTEWLNDDDKKEEVIDVTP